MINFDPKVGSNNIPKSCVIRPITHASFIRRGKHMLLVIITNSILSSRKFNICIYKKKTYAFGTSSSSLLPTVFFHLHLQEENICCLALLLLIITNSILSSRKFNIYSKLILTNCFKTAHPSPIIVTLVQTYQNYFNIRPPLSPPLPDGR